MAEVCRNFRNNGSCRFMEDCKFEHSEGEPVAPPPRGPCFTFAQGEGCKYEDQCRFRHGDDDTRFVERDAAAASGQAPRRRNRKRGGRREPQDGDAEQADGASEAAPRRRRAPKEQVCHAFRDEGSCQYEEKCRFKHGPDDTRDLVTIRREARGECYTFRDTGSCEYEDNCRFTH